MWHWQALCQLLLSCHFDWEFLGTLTISALLCSFCEESCREYRQNYHSAQKWCAERRENGCNQLICRLLLTTCCTASAPTDAQRVIDCPCISNWNNRSETSNKTAENQSLDLLTVPNERIASFSLGKINIESVNGIISPE